MTVDMLSQENLHSHLTVSAMARLSWSHDLYTESDLANFWFSLCVSALSVDPHRGLNQMTEVLQIHWLLHEAIEMMRMHVFV